MTYSTNFGNPAIEATNWNDLQFILSQLPDNTAQLISPQDVRDAIYTTWEQGTFKVVTVGGENYIGTDNGGTVSNYRYKMFLGKKELQPGNSVLNNSLLTSDTDIFIYNNKSDSNLSLQDTKISFLAGDNLTIFGNAPYLEATKTVGTVSDRIDLNLTNPASGGIIEINADNIELGDNNGWVIDDITGELYPQNNGQAIGQSASGGNRIGTIYMASKVDYLNNLEFQSGTASPITFNTDGKLVAYDLDVVDNFRFKLTATAGYFLTTDGTGQAIWGPGRIDTVGITQGYMSLADGINDVYWVRPYADATGVTAGYVLAAQGGTAPSYTNLGNLNATGVTAGFVLGSDGTKTTWVSNVTGAEGVDGSIQFSTSGFLDADDDNFHWDQSNARLGIGTASPSYSLHVVGDTLVTDTFKVLDRITGSNSNDYIDLNSNLFEIQTTKDLNIGVNGGVLLTAGDTIEMETPFDMSFLAETGITVTADGSDFNLESDNTILNSAATNIIATNTIDITSDEIRFSTITPSSEQVVIGATGLGIKTDPERPFHVNGGMRLNPINSASMTSPSNGDLYYDTTDDEFLAYSNGWYQTSNKTLIVIKASDLRGVTGTYDSKSCTAATLGTIGGGRIQAMSLAPSGYSLAVFDGIMPPNYIFGRDVRVTIVYTINVNLGGTVRTVDFSVGMGSNTSSFTNSDATISYTGLATFVSGGSYFRASSISFTFSPSINPFEQFVIPVIRNGAIDNFASDVYLHSITVEMI